jgi:lysophospholipid acyltransferase (LPLAT)-like uncharacterized protein
VSPPPARETEVLDAARERRLRWTVRVGVLLIRLLAWTWRIRLIGNETTIDAVWRARQTVVFAIWHGDMLPLLYQHRDRGTAVLISEHHDGELIARIAERFGFRTIRGSTSRGAVRALVNLVNTLRAGRDVAITPDGPRGPPHSFAPGAVIAAQRAEVPIIAVCASASRAWRLRRSWDRFLIPKPFSRVTIAYVGPTRPEGDTLRAAAEETKRFQTMMLEAERLANT